MSIAGSRYLSVDCWVADPPPLCPKQGRIRESKKMSKKKGEYFFLFVYLFCKSDTRKLWWYCYLYNCLRREQDGIMERSLGTLERKSKGSPSNMLSRVEIVSTRDLIDKSSSWFYALYTVRDVQKKNNYFWSDILAQLVDLIQARVQMFRPLSSTIQPLTHQSHNSTL